jgi:hypothetical protein
LVSFPTPAPSPPGPDLTATLEATLAGPHSSSGIPVVQMVSPISNTQVSISQTLSIVAYAADDTGVTRIELTDDGSPVHTEDAPTPAPTVFSAVIPWTPTELGSHVLRVVAYDAANRASAPDQVTVSVTPDTRKPAAVIVYPLGSPQVELGSVLQVQAIAVDEVAVTEVDLLVDNQIYTYVTSQSAGGQTPFPIVFSWPAMTAGTHTLVVRAHDNQDQTTDSAALRVSVVDNHPPALSIAFDRTNAFAGEPITVTISALDVGGIQRVELWVGKDTSIVTTSSNPARQTLMTVRTAWTSATAGDYTLFARAYNADGNYRDSASQTISILSPGQATPAPAATATATRTRAPGATATPKLQPPTPPIAQMLQPEDKFTAQAPLRFTFGGIGNAELDHIELWAFAQDQPMPQLICTVDARATTQMNAQCDWAPATAGIYYFFAQAVDLYHQIGHSATISGFIGVPGPATVTPTPVSFAGVWASESYTATFRTSGGALRGDFSMVDTEGRSDGRITSGTTRSDHVNFHVDFGSADPPATPTTAPTPESTASVVEETATPEATPTETPLSTPSLDFDCAVDASASTLTCSWKDSRGSAGSAVFHRQTAAP